MPSGAVFAGKATFGSDGSAPRAWLTVGEFEIDDGETLLLPIVRAPSAGYEQRLIAYERSGGGTLLQILRLRQGRAERWWLALIAAFGWIGLVPEGEPERASAFEPVPDGAAATRLYLLDGARRPVTYTTGASGLLTVLGASARAFATERITPPLAEIRAHGGANADLGDVDLRGESLAGVGLSGASFVRAQLAGTVFDGADVSGAAFAGATLDEAAFAGATLDGADFTGTAIAAVRWNAPKSARGIVLARCSGRGTRLGVPGARTPLDASGADLSNADLRGAVLDRCDLSDANLTGALIADGASAAGAIFDRAQLTGAVGSYAIFRDAQFKRARGAGAVFAGADLRGAVLDGAQFGTKALLFGLDRAYAAELDRDRYPSPGLVTAFTSHGAPITPHSEIDVVVASKRWRIAGTRTVYEIADPGGPAPLDVYDTAGVVAPAVFAGARLDGARALGAGLSGTDLSRVRWGGGVSSFANADCTGASFAGAQLVDIDASQALLDGASFADAVLIGVRLGGARIRFVPGTRRPSFT
ncbi:MAG TPA: pentapeptide repeat-containing protein, partial [Candidatus Elarobacter sp.]|nr:pentapeptide repeat-containing protein [Candidatus Elarobacter sp.]